MGAQNKAGARCCEISRRRRWRCPTFKRLPPCHSGPWRARAVPLELQDLKPRRAPWLCRRPSANSVGQRAAIFGRGSSLSPTRATRAPPAPLPSVHHAWSCLVFVGLRWSGRVYCESRYFPWKPGERAADDPATLFLLKAPRGLTIPECNLKQKTWFPAEPEPAESA